jgi:SSS family solute:Na+ symporter
MQLLDWIVIFIFTLLLVGIVVWVVKKKSKDSKDYFLGGRDITWLAIGASIFASNIALNTS